MALNPSGTAREPVDDDVEYVEIHGGDHRVARFLEVGSNRLEHQLGSGTGGMGLRECSVEPGTEIGFELLLVLGTDIATLEQLLCVDRPHGLVRVDELVHAGLGEGGLVGLVVAVPPIADEVDDDVFVERASERIREMHHAHRGLGIVTVHMEDRRLHHLRDVGGVHTRAAEVGRGREPELIVHDHVYGAADFVAGYFGEVEGLRDDTLAGERGVTVHEHGQHGVAALVLLGVADGAGDAFDDGADGLEVAGIGRKREVDLGAGRRLVLAGRAEVILHVAGTLRTRRIELTLELAEDLLVRLAEHVRERVETATVCHTEHHVGHPGVGGFAAQSVEHRDERLGALEAEALLPEVLRVQEALERLGGVEPLEDPALLLLRDDGRDAFDPLLDPLLLIGFLDVHVLDADRARVRVTQDAEDVSERHQRREASGTQVPDRELAVEVPDGEVVVRDVELGVRVRLTPAERVEVRDEVTADAVHVDQSVDLHDLLELRRGIGKGAAVRVPARRLVRHREAREHVVVEPVVPEQQVVDPPQELTALRTGDDAVVVRVGERGDLAHAELGECRRVGALVLGRVADRADADDEALTRHQSRHRVDGADHAGVRDRAGGPREVVGRHRAAAHLLDQRLVCLPEAGEVECVSLLHARHQERVRSVASHDVDGEPQVDVLVSYDDGFALVIGERRVEPGEIGECAEHCERDEVGEADLAGAGACELIVQDLTVDLEQLGRHRAHRCRGGHTQAGFHVLDGARRRASQRLRLVAVEDHRPRRRSLRGSGGGR